MPRKQATVNESTAAAASARAAKPKAPRVKSAKHTKASAADPAAVTEMNPAIDTAPLANEGNAAVLDSAAIANVLQAELPVEQIETSLFVSAVPSESATAQPNGDSREEIALLAYGYWLARGCVGGDPIEDWVRAENEYHQRLG